MKVSCLGELSVFCDTLCLNIEIRWFVVFFFLQNTDTSKFSLVKQDFYFQLKPKETSAGALPICQKNSVVLSSHAILKLMASDSALEHQIFSGV